MSKDVQRAVRELANASAGWFVRRDGADRLGDIASQALAALNQYKNDKDTDVRLAVEKALGHARAGLEGVVPVVESEKELSLEDLAHACAREGVRDVSRYEEGFVVACTLPQGRKQAVYLMPDKQKDGTELVRVFTPCGPAKKDACEWALRTNGQLTQGALALEKWRGEELLVMVHCFLLSETSPLELKAAVKELAYYADWMEKKLTKRDEF